MLKLGIYQHYKGNLYQVIGVARHEETHEPLAVYQKLYDDYALWVRPLDVFLETVTVNGTTVPRFAFVKEHLLTPPKVDAL